ncbi:MAG: MarR family transcriptional regulator [Mycobacterium sp.]|nr:MarR family transcriptional regulator [Mycobacterium sp.]
MPADPNPDPMLLQLLRAVALLEDQMAPVFDELGVTAEQWRILVILAGAEGDGHTMTELSRLAVLPPATTTRAIDELISLALVYRRVDPADRRRVMVFLSPHGSGALAAVDDRQRQIERDLATSVGSRRYLALGDSLAHLTR